MSSRTRIAQVACAALLGVALAAPAAAADKATFVPYRAWKAVERAAKAQFATDAQLFKTEDTKAQSAGLMGANSGTAWIVGAKSAGRQGPGPAIMPYLPKQTYFLVAKDTKGHWQATQLGGMGKYLTQVDAATQNPSVHVGVGIGTPGGVCHGVEVSNATRLQCLQGTALASKSNGPLTQTMYVKGQPERDQPYALQANAEVAAYPKPQGWCGTVVPRHIPVTFSQVFFAQGNAQ